MTSYDAVVIGIAALVLLLPLGLGFHLVARVLAFVIRSVRSPSWRERPWSPWKMLDWNRPYLDVAFFNRPPQLTPRQSLIIWAVAVVIAICGSWNLYYHAGL
jgi:hypothetical protein